MKSSATWFFIPVAVSIFFAVCLGFFSIGNLYNADEGMILNGAWRMYHGDRLYEDHFSFVAPGSYWWTELSFHILGPTYLSARIFSLFLLVLSVLAIHRMTVLVGGSVLAAASSALAWFLLNVLNRVAINHNNHSSYVASIGLLFLLYALTIRNAAVFFLAGVFIGLTAVFLQTKGLVLVAGLGVLMCVYAFRGMVTKKNLLFFSVGCCVFPTVVFLIWSPSLLFDALIRWPSEHYFSVSNVSPFGWLIVMAVFLAISYTLWKKKATLRMPFVFVVAVSQFLMMIAALTRPDATHLLLASFGLVVLCALVLETYVPAFQKAILFVLCISVLVFSVGIGSQMIRREQTFLAFVRDVPFDKIFVHPYSPGLYFELGVKHSYRYEMLLTGMYPEEAFLENLAVLQSEKPDHIFVDYDLAQRFGHDKENVVDQYIDANYEIVKSSGSLRILRRR